MRREVFEPSDVFVKRDISINIKTGKDETTTMYLVEILINNDPFDNAKSRKAFVSFEKKLAIELSMDNIGILQPQCIQDDRWSRFEISCKYVWPINTDQSDNDSKNRLTKKYYELFALWEPCDHFGKKLID